MGESHPLLPARLRPLSMNAMPPIARSTGARTRCIAALLLALAVVAGTRCDRHLVDAPIPSPTKQPSQEGAEAPPAMSPAGPTDGSRVLAKAPASDTGDQPPSVAVVDWSLEPSTIAQETKILVPTTAAERQLFCETLLATFASQVLGGADDIRKNYARQLPANASQAAIQALETAVSYDLAYRVAYYDALATHVMSGASLEAATQKPGAQGRSGNFTCGLLDWQRAAWGGATAVKIAFFLDFDTHTQLRGASSRLSEARAELRRAAAAEAQSSGGRR